MNKPSDFNSHVSHLNGDAPAVYVGTYGKYNAGSLDGAWIDLSTFDNYDDFLKWCHELHSDDENGDPELMFQDFENFPKSMYGESSLDPAIWDYIDDDFDPEARDAIIDYYGDFNDYLRVRDDAIVHKTSNMADIARELVDDLGGVSALNDAASYFDYEAFGRDVSFEGVHEDEYESVQEEWGLDENASDQELGEAIVEQLGFDGIGKETIENYFDYEAFGRDLQMEGTWIEFPGGIIEIRD